jgi:hypothetical protein
LEGIRDPSYSRSWTARTCLKCTEEI